MAHEWYCTSQASSQTSRPQEGRADGHEAFPEPVTTVPTPVRGEASPEGKQRRAGISGFGDRLRGMLACSQADGLKGEPSGDAGCAFSALHMGLYLRVESL